MWIVREGYEGLVRGNTKSTTKQVTIDNISNPDVANNEETTAAQSPPDQNLLHNLRFGDGDLLRDGTSEYAMGGRTLKGRYIVRVGWDDVRGWFSEVSSWLSIFQPVDWNSSLRVAPLSAQLGVPRLGLWKAGPLLLSILSRRV